MNLSLCQTTSMRQNQCNQCYNLLEFQCLSQIIQAFECESKQMVCKILVYARMGKSRTKILQHLEGLETYSKIGWIGVNNYESAFMKVTMKFGKR
mmetsp:Transcript_18591/g.22633  ORF Transcript_18591/g.22633 Transcript_18591/m.22633 type:complete len:95 (+) Transcript_18591:612-896(+)